MTDQEKRETVIKGLECCESGNCYECPYDMDLECPGFEPTPKKLLKDAMELLKAQEPVKPVYNWDCDWEECQNCGYVLSKMYNPCPGCGRAVKWG